MNSPLENQQQAAIRPLRALEYMLQLFHCCARMYATIISLSIPSLGTRDQCAIYSIFSQHFWLTISFSLLLLIISVAVYVIKGKITLTLPSTPLVLDSWLKLQTLINIVTFVSMAKHCYLMGSSNFKPNKPVASFARWSHILAAFMRYRAEAFACS